MKIEPERLSITLPVRFSQPVYQTLKDEAWGKRKHYSAMVRELVEEGLRKRGWEIPEPMNAEERMNYFLKR